MESIDKKNNHTNRKSVSAWQVAQLKAICNGWYAVTKIGLPSSLFAHGAFFEFYYVATEESSQRWDNLQPMSPLKRICLWMRHVKKVKCCFDDEGNEAANVGHDFQKLHPVISNSMTGGEINNKNNVREMRGHQNSLSWWWNRMLCGR